MKQFYKSAQFILESFICLIGIISCASCHSNNCDGDTFFLAPDSLWSQMSHNELKFLKGISDTVVLGSYHHVDSNYSSSYCTSGCTDDGSCYQPYTSTKSYTTYVAADFSIGLMSNIHQRLNQSSNTNTTYAEMSFMFQNKWYSLYEHEKTKTVNGSTINNSWYSTGLPLIIGSKTYSNVWALYLNTEGYEIYFSEHQLIQVKNTKKSITYNWIP